MLKHSLNTIFASSFIRQSSVYLIGNVINAVIPFVLLPILTRYLTPTDYGIVGTSIVLVQMLTMFIGFNASGLIVGSHFDNNLEDNRKLISTIAWLSVAVSIVMVAIFLLFGNLVEDITKFPAKWLSITVAIAFLGVIHTLYLIMLQVRKASKTFIGIQIGLTLLNFGIAILLVVGAGMDWRGRLIASVVSGAVIAGVCLYGLSMKFQLLRMIFDRGALRALLFFGIPLIPHSIGGWVMVMMPRLYLNNMASVADTGLFSVGYNIAAPIAMIIGAGNQAYMPALFSRLSDSGNLDKLRLSRVLLLGVVFLILLGVIYGFLAKCFLPVIVGPRFYAAADYVLWLALAFSMQGVYFVFANFVVYSKKTSLIAWRADFLGGIVVILLCPVLIRWMGPVGAAQSVFIAFAISVIGCVTASRRAFAMPWGDAVISLVRKR